MASRIGCHECRRLTGVVSLLAGLLLAGVLEAATPATPAKPAKPATTWVQTLTQEALDSGFLSRLPPNVCVVFGLAKPEEGTDVRQLLSKDGHQIRTFNVSVANHADVVIFDVNAQSSATVAYLVAPEGQLRRAVSYKPGGQARDLSAAEAKSGFAHEKQFWSARARKSPSASAAPAPPPAAPSGPGH
jgi:hypothetical protein